MSSAGVEDGALAARLATVTVLALDVDGVLTDGSLVYGPDGEALKTFHVRDGLGVRLARSEGIAIAVITAKRSPMLARRLADLGIEHVLDGREDKGAALAELAERLGTPLDRIAYCGDDVLDLGAMRIAGVAIAVADAHPRARAEAAWVTSERGGRGAVREITDALLEARGRLDAACEALVAGAGAGARRTEGAR